MWNFLLLLSLALAWTVEKAEVAISGSGDIGERVPVSQVNSPLELYAGRSVDIAFVVSDNTNEEFTPPTQAFLRISASEDPNVVDKQVVAKFRNKNGKIIMPYKQVPPSLHNQKLKAELLISGGESDPVRHNLFEIVVLGDDDSVPNNLRQYGMGHSLKAKPEIVHIFPKEPKHVNFIIALAFVGMIDVLFAMLLKLWFEIDGFKLPNSVQRSALLGLVVAIEFVFVLYYLGWSIFNVIWSVVILLPALLVSLSKSSKGKISLDLKEKVSQVSEKAEKVTEKVTEKVEKLTEKPKSKSKGKKSNN